MNCEEPFISSGTVATVITLAPETKVSCVLLISLNLSDSIKLYPVLPEEPDTDIKAPAVVCCISI